MLIKTNHDSDDELSEVSEFELTKSIGKNDEVTNSRASNINILEQNLDNDEGVYRREQPQINFKKPNIPLPKKETQDPLQQLEQMDSDLKQYYNKPTYNVHNYQDEDEEDGDVSSSESEPKYKNENNSRPKISQQQDNSKKSVRFRHNNSV